MIIKALAGGGGRGTRAVLSADELERAFQRCQSEAGAAFGRAEVYVEEFIPRARHVEVQILGDRAGGIAHLGERECSIQRRFQKIVEIAPAPALDDRLARAIIDAAVRFAKHVGYTNLGTFEFLVDVSGRAGAQPFVFIEANARLQVEHTVTEAVTGVDLVQAQIRLAQGATLKDLGLDAPGIARPRGYAIQARVNMETIGPDGSVRPGGGTLDGLRGAERAGRADGWVRLCRLPHQRRVRLAARQGHRPRRRTSRRRSARASRALSEFRLEGVATNIAFLRNILAHADFAAGTRPHALGRREHGARWSPRCRISGAASWRRRGPQRTTAGSPAHGSRAAIRWRCSPTTPGEGGTGDGRRRGRGPRADRPRRLGRRRLPDPGHHRRHRRRRRRRGAPGPAGRRRRGDEDGARDHRPARRHRARRHDGGGRRGARRLSHRLHPGGRGRGRRRRRGGRGWTRITSATTCARTTTATPSTLDENRPDAVARRRKLGYRMPRENIDAPRRSRVLQGILAARRRAAAPAQHHRGVAQEHAGRRRGRGHGSINGALFDETRSRAVVVHYDYTVLAGTQGHRNHYKQDRIFELAQRFRLPLVLFGEGGGGRPGEDDIGPRVAVDTHTFTTFSQLSGLVPLVAIVNGRTFAGNTALVACSDVIIATEGSTLGMGGPAMIEGGGLGIYTPEEVGPMSVQVPNGVVDILVKDEDEAVDVAKKYLSYFQGAVADVGGARPAPPAARRAGEPAAAVRHAGDHRHHRRRGLRAGDPREVRHRHHHRLHPRRGTADGSHRQQSPSSGRRDRLRRRRQGRALHAAVRRLRHSRAEPDRLPRHHGRSGSRADGAGPPLHAPVQRGRQHDRAAVHRRRPQGLRPGRAGDVRRRHAGRLLRRRLAHGRVRRHEHRRRGQARLPQGAHGDRGSRGAARGVRAPDRERLRQRQGGQCRGGRRDRRRDRSGGHARAGSPAA